MNSKAFTLIELLVVIAIIGLLSSIVLVSLQGAKDQADIGKAQEFAHTVRVTLGADLVGEWKFDNNTNDSSGYENNGTMGDDPSYVDGMFGKALEFDGNDYVSIPDSDFLDLTELGTIEVWAKKNSQKHYQMYITKGIASANTGYQLMDYGTTGRIVLRWGSDGNNIVTDEVVPTDKWYHIVGTYDGSDLRIYLNGSLSKKVPYTTNAVANTDPLRIGRRSDGYFFDGTLDEVRIYNKALSSAEIQQLYAQGAVKHGIVLK